MRNENSVSVMLAAACALAAVILFRGFSLSYLAFIPLAAAAGFSAGTFLLPVLAVLLACGFAAPDMIPWAALAGGIIASVAGTGLAVRVSGFLTAAVCLWFVPLEASAVPLAVSAAGAFFSKNKVPGYAGLGVGVLLSAFVTGLPRSPVPSSVTAVSYAENSRINFSVPSLNSGVREAVIPAPVSGEWVMWLAYRGGGVRDTMPLAAVTLREEIVVLPAEPESLCFIMSPGDTLRISLVRQCRPFIHPVIHLSTGGELI